YRELRAFALFDGLPNDVLHQAIAGGDMAIVELDRDEILLDATSAERLARRVFLVLQGQVAVAVFPSGKLDELRAVPAKKRTKQPNIEPLQQLAKKNLATFSTGELFGAQALPEVEIRQSACYGVERSRILSIDKPRLTEIMNGFPFFQKR